MSDIVFSDELEAYSVILDKIIKLGLRGVHIAAPQTISKYASEQGTTPRLIENQIARGTVPTIKVGKRRLVNTYKIAMECLNQDD